MRGGHLPRWFSAAGKVASWLVTLLAACLLLAFIGWVTLPRILNLQAVVVLTGSMEPDLPIGSIAFVEKTGARDIALGDVLTFYRPDVPQRVLVTHRVVAIERQAGQPAFRTRGDADTTAGDRDANGHTSGCHSDGDSHAHHDCPHPGNLALMDSR